MEQPCLLAFWSPPWDQQLGRVIDMKHVRRDLGNNCIVQTPTISDTLTIYLRIIFPYLLFFPIVWSLKCL
jgi:hypothetical protein